MPLSRDSIWVKLLLAPLLGLVFVVFLPFIGFVLVGEALWRHLTKGPR